MAITVRFIADVVNWLNGLGQSEEAIDENAAALEDLMAQAVDLGKQAGRTTDEIADDFSKAFGVPVDRAKQAIEELGDEASDTGDTVEKELGGAATGVGVNMTELGSIARDVLEGDFGSAASSAISALGGIAAFAGAGGALAGLLASAAGQLVGSWISEWQRAGEESKKRASEWAQAYLDAGGQVLTAAVTASNALEIITDPEKFAKAKENAENWGTSVSTAVAAMAGENWALEAAQKSVNDQLDEGADIVARYRDEANKGVLTPETIEAYNQYKGATRDGAEALKQLNDEMAAGQDQAATYSQYLREVAENTAGATRETDEFGDTIVTLPDGKKIYIDAETGQATDDIEAIENKEYSTTVMVGADTSAAARQIAGLAKQITIPVNLNVTPNVTQRPGQRAYYE